MITAEHNELIRGAKKKGNSNWTFSDQFVRSLNRSKFKIQNELPFVAQGYQAGRGPQGDSKHLHENSFQELDDKKIFLRLLKLLHTVAVMQR